MATNSSNQQPAGVWRKARASVTKGYCVEALIGADAIDLRDSKGPEEARLRFDRPNWTVFLEGLNHSE